MTDILLGAYVFDSGLYRWIRNDPMGRVPDPGLSLYDAKRCNWAVQFIQRRLLLEGFDPHRTDGVFGWRTQGAAKQFQKAHSLRFVDGLVGRTTMGELFRPLVLQFGAKHAVPREYAAGVPLHESGFDPAAVGASTPIERGIDRGLYQINSKSHPEVSDAQAYDGEFNLHWGVKRLAAYHLKYASQPNIAWDCAIAANATPVGADEWFAQGTAPSEILAAYVAGVKALGAAFWA